MDVRLAITGFVAVLAMPVIASAAVLSPSSYSATIGVGETISINKTITLDESGPALSKVDVFFLADNTGSMGGILDTVKTGASTILTAIAGGDPRFAGIDVGFGVGRYLGDPVEGVPPGTAYQLQQAITSNQAAVQAQINGWFASGGGDTPEANFFALQQVATEGGPTAGGIGTGQETGWRDNAGRIIVWFGDAESHTATVNQAQVISALTDSDAIVAGINTQSAGFGIDSAGQASAVTAATGGSLTNGVTGANLDATIEAILNAVEEATGTIDLLFTTSGDTSGVDIAFACTDSLGCDDVNPGETRSFRVDITGLNPGTYDFEVSVVGVRDAVENDRIVVNGDGPPPSVPEPATLVLIGTGLLGLGGARLWARR